MYIVKEFTHFQKFLCLKQQLDFMLKEKLAFSKFALKLMATCYEKSCLQHLQNYPVVNIYITINI